MNALEVSACYPHILPPPPRPTLEQCVKCPSTLKIHILSTHLDSIQQTRGLLHFSLYPTIIIVFFYGGEGFCLYFCLFVCCCYVSVVVLYLWLSLSAFLNRPSPNVYFPFGIGHRSCIAKHFAMVTLN